MEYEGIIQQYLTTGIDVERNGFSEDDAWLVASKLEAAIAGIDETTQETVDHQAVQDVRDSIITHEHGDKRLYASLIRRPFKYPIVYSVASTPDKTMEIVRRKQYSFTQPQLGSVFNTDNDDYNYRVLQGHVESLIDPSLDTEYIDTVTKQSSDRPELTRPATVNRATHVTSPLKTYVTKNTQPRPDIPRHGK